MKQLQLHSLLTYTLKSPLTLMRHDNIKTTQLCSYVCCGLYYHAGNNVHFDKHCWLHNLLCCQCNFIYQRFAILLNLSQHKQNVVLCFVLMCSVVIFIAVMQPHYNPIYIYTRPDIAAVLQLYCSCTTDNYDVSAHMAGM